MALTPRRFASLARFLFFPSPFLPFVFIVVLFFLRISPASLFNAVRLGTPQLAGGGTEMTLASDWFASAPASGRRGFASVMTMICKQAPPPGR